MAIDDPALPAAPHLVGDGAIPALAAAIDAHGGRLERVRPCEVQYRPGRDLVVRYDATVTWGSSRESRGETLLASTTHHGIPAGTVPIEATDDSGRTISIGVWKWPFDPVLVGLTSAVTPAVLGRVLGPLTMTPVSVRVRAYRPTERAVVQVSGADGADLFVKVLPPDTVAPVVERHRRLHAAGVPVPGVLAVDEELGLVVLSALRGRTMREQLTSHVGPWPTSTAFSEVFAGFARAELTEAGPVRSRASMALGHARMLRAVAPELGDQLDPFDDPFRLLAGRSEDRTGPTIHGDLYDAQVFSHGSRITGVLDVDDAGPGDPVDDRATVLGFLLAKAIYAGAEQAPLVRYVQTLRRGFRLDVDPDDLDQATAAVLVGLATGPFRSQRDGWRGDVARHLRLAHNLLESPDNPAFN
jgi:hypothetical protein